MSIELIAEDPQVKIKKEFHFPEEFRLIDHSKICNGSCNVPKEKFEKWLPEPKPPKELNWIVEEVLEDVKMDSIATDIVDTVISNENSDSQNALVVREFTMTALSEDIEDDVDIHNVIYPIINDPFIMGQIACTALLNKLFVTQVFSCERATIILALCDEWSKSVQDNVEQAMVSGFKEIASEANIEINQVEIHVDFSCMVGGVLTATRLRGQVGFPKISCIGDVIVLTKALGVQMALNAYKIYQQEQNEVKDRLNRIISAEDLKKAYDSAIFLLTSLNRQAVKLTQGFEVHAATEINGHSLMKHSQMLAEQQLNEVAFYIYNLPLIGKMLHVSKVLGSQPDLILGNIPEICGGLLLVMPREQAAGYCRKMLNEGQHAWIIGMVEKGRRGSNMIKKARVIEWNWSNEASA